MHNDSLWYFLTSESTSNNFNTRIDLVFDLIAQKPNNQKNYFTFFYFNDCKKNGENLTKIWQDVEHTFLTLRDWYEDHELFHKIGYLITISGHKNSLSEIYKLHLGKTKQEFREAINQKIKNSIDGLDLDVISYDDYEKAKKILLLFNIESTRQNGANSERFAFDKFKLQNWSLEHIHARQSENIKKQAEWIEWVKSHLESIKNIFPNEKSLTQEMEDYIKNPNASREQFEDIFEKTIQKLSQDDEYGYENSLTNLALLDVGSNAALSNSTFDVKRNIIIEKDKRGQFIPFCTRMVFLKYYTNSKDAQLHFWSKKDREAYIKAIKDKIKPYLREDF